MTASAKPLARKEPEAAGALLSGKALVRLLPRHWIGRLVERCRVDERVVQDSVHARLHGKYRLKVHQAAIWLAAEHQKAELGPLMEAVTKRLADPAGHEPIVHLSSAA